GAAAYLAVAVPVLVLGGGVGPAGAEEAAPGLLFLHLVAPVEGQVRLLAGVAGVARLVPRVPVGLGVRVTRAVVDGGLGVQVARAVIGRGVRVGALCPGVRLIAVRVAQGVGVRGGGEGAGLRVNAFLEGGLTLVRVARCAVVRGQDVRLVARHL